MRPRLLPRLAPLVVPALLLGGCGQDQPPTAPASPDPGDPAFSHTAGHKVVNSLSDPGDGTCDLRQCTLREAIDDPESTEISFAPGLTGAITLRGTLGIDKALTITGPRGGIVLRRGSADRDFRILRILTGANVRLTNLTIRNGTGDRAGGIVNWATLALVNCTVANNAGGGIDNHGTLTLTHSTIASNAGIGITNHAHQALSATSTRIARNAGPGILNDLGTLELTGGAVELNTGGGIFTAQGRATLTEVRITGNSTAGLGGGIQSVGATVVLTNSTVARNSAAEGGGIANRDGSSLTVAGTTIAGNSATAGRGGGIFNRVQERLAASVTLTNSTVSGNSAREGGGIYNSGFLDFASVSITNSTIARNSAGEEGGGIRQEFDEGMLTLKNTLVAQNTAPTGPDVSEASQGSRLSASFSLIGDGRGSGITNTGGNQVGRISPNGSPIDPRIGSLADNGGPTRTHALNVDSPARDAASTPDCPTTDQRGVLRPQGAACDIGSFELGVTAGE
ncbi:MAG TPA: right-handed parallel beta-helix repeat-containing protein [Gemmatimonadales bacterium]|nr:right-handed parallel beta-helix repeat-containing protein [Gemmatimonadales bacterium]